MELSGAPSAFTSLPPPRLRGGEPVRRVNSPGSPFDRRDTYTPSGQAPTTTDSKEAPDAPEDPTAPRGQDGEPLSEAEQDQVEQLEARDREVRAHEMAHKAAAGPYATSGPTYSYQTGPDGKRYAVGGSVGIDLSAEETPEATIQKMEVVRRAALAPAEPSSQDQRVAARASQIAMEARQEKLQNEREGDEDTNNATPGTSAETSVSKLERKPLDVYA
ncbi:MAG: putative metalloprotease CJM1_0395 family protein [Planctomycetota bacterium]